MASKKSSEYKIGGKEKEDSGQQRTVRVWGLDAKDEETCKYYFENTKRSGGGDIEGDDIKWDADESCFLITFRDDEAVQRVLKCQHKLKEKEVIVELWSPPSSSSSLSPFSSNIILSDVPKGTSEDLLQNFLESLLDVNVSSISLDQHSGKAVVAMAEPVEIAELKRVCSENSLFDNVRLSVQSVSVSDTILVRNIKPETNDECVKFFFMNKNRNKGGPVKNIKRLNETSALICFQNPEDAKAVVKKDKHVLDGNILQVTPHISELMESKAHQTVTTSGHQDFVASKHIPGPRISKALKAESPERQHFSWQHHNKECQNPRLSQTSSKGNAYQKFPSQGADTNAFVPHFNKNYTDNHEDMDWNDSDQTDPEKPVVYSNKDGKTNYPMSSPDTAHSHYIEKSPKERGTAALHNSSHGGYVHDNYADQDMTSRHYFQNYSRVGENHQDTLRPLTPRIIVLNRYIADSMQDEKKRKYIEGKLQEIDGHLYYTGNEYKVLPGGLTTTGQIWETKVIETLNEIHQTLMRDSQQYSLSSRQCELKNLQPFGGTGYESQFRNPYSDGQEYSSPMLNHENRHGVNMSEKKPSPNFYGTCMVDQCPKNEDKAKEQIQDRNCGTVVYGEWTCSLKPHQMKYFSIPQACHKLEKKFQGLELKLDKESKCLKMRAPENVFTKVKTDVLSCAVNLIERKIPISKAMAIMYSRKETKDLVQEMLDKGDYTFYWEVSDASIIVCAPEEEFKKTEHSFLWYFKEDEVPLDEKMASLLKSDTWKTFEKDMQQAKHGCVPPVLMTSDDEKKIIIVDRAECIETAKQKIAAFFQVHKPDKMILTASKSQLKFLQEFCSGILEDKRAKAKEMGVYFAMKKDGLVLEGPVNSVSLCFAEMSAVLDKIVCEKETFSGPGVAKYLLSSKGKDWLEQTGKFSKCLVTTVSEQNPRSAQSGDNLLATCNLGMGAQLMIIQGDIIQCAVDAIVNAANQNLHHAYGLAAAVVQAGGQAIQDECKKFVKRHGPLPEGSVMETGAGHLQFTCILHAVGPVWHDGHSGEKNILTNTVKEILLMAEKRNLTSVAIPALSCGLFKYPVDKATKAIVRSISKHFTSASAGSSLRKVVLIDTKAEPLKGFISAARKLFASSIEVKAEPDETAQYRPHKERFESASSRSLSSHSGDKSPATPIRIIPGEIAKSKADVIVCTVHPSLDLKKGVLSRSILEQGGNKIQEELQSYAAKYGSVRLGKVVRTSGGNLQCKSIFHMSLPTWKEDKGQTMKLAIQECLDEAEKKHAKSIALPAMGTGKLGYPNDQVASIMFEAIRKWSHSNRDASIKDVQIIVYSKDRDTLQAFKQLEQQGEAYHRDSKHSGSSRGRRSRGQADHIEEDNSHSEHKMWKDVNVYIYSDERQAIRDTVEAIHRYIKESTKSQIERDSLIANFNQHKKSAVLSLQSKHDVKINLDETRSSIKITGFEVDVAKAISDFKDILLDASKQRHLAAGMPPVRWQYEVESDKFRDFEPEQVIEIEAAYKNKEPEVRLKDKRGRQYKIVFKDNLEYVLGSKSDNKPIKVRRRDILRENTQDIPLPRHWAKMGKDEKVKLVDLDPSSSEFKRVEQNFNKQATLKKIQRVQNPTLFQQFKVKKKELEKYNSHVKENEKRLWHGTDSGSVTSIITNGFNRSYCGKNGTALGNGVYFAKDASVSMGYARDGYMFQARVLVGEPAQGSANMKLPPKKSNSDRLYDSLADTPANPNVYVIFHDTQAYPEYLLTF